jgi:hypothetical protein
VIVRLRDPRWQRVLTLAFTETISWGILYYAFSVLLVPMEEALGAGRAELSTAFSIAIVARALSAPAAGSWVDRHGVRSLMTAGSLAGVLLVLAWSSVTSVVAAQPRVRRHRRRHLRRPLRAGVRRGRTLDARPGPHDGHPVDHDRRRVRVHDLPPDHRDAVRGARVARGAALARTRPARRDRRPTRAAAVRTAVTH